MFNVLYFVPRCFPALFSESADEINSMLVDEK